MNKQLQQYARDTLKSGLSQCTDDEQTLFKRMYAGGRMEMPVNAVIDCMATEKLDWAMEQVQRTLDKKAQ